MLANFFHFLTRRQSAEEYDLAFVKGVAVQPAREPRSRRSEFVLVLGWVLIGLKCLGVSWLISLYQVPINPWCINAPTLGAAAICTLIYLRRS